MNKITKSIVGLVVGLTVALGAIGGASAADSDTRYAQSTWTAGGYYYGARNFVYFDSNRLADCTIYAALPTAGTAFGYGTVPCSHRHVATYIRVTLNVTTPGGVVASSNGWKGPSGNSYGMGGWYQTPLNTCNHNYKYQTVVEAQVDNTYSYATTGSPRTLC